MNKHISIQHISLLIPYITVGTGLLILHNAWIAIFSYHLAMVLILLSSKNKPRFKTIFKTSNFVFPLISLIIGACGGITLYLCWPLFSVPANIDIYLKQLGLNELTWPMFLAYHILVNPWIEEFFWRGYLGSNKKSLVISDLFFAGYHLLVLAGKMDILWLVIVFVVLSCSAWLWRQITRFSQGLLSSIVSHFAADLTIMLAIFILTRQG